MTDKINELLRRVEEFKPKAAAEIEDFRIKILGKKGELTALMEEFKTVAPELKRELGQQLNRLKNEATERINTLREQLQNAAADNAAGCIVGSCFVTLQGETPGPEEAVRQLLEELKR